ncbi:uncharacterized protein LOC131156489 isoform X2 [Malania oleifera]|uniref:uncharacterized protein LOC131156489 isoform X2 n=1 Tax=Malania oleifera TaxID=397392 RepID=UPI0025AE0058|nr:uncharacterized protein LOC131156489 isoform X2 [Malania oleifera]XP_057966194.1 uncharacterized protein LOC131156489 isoform X2 [Malania oleifera]
MGFDLGLFDDMVPEPARAGASEKFQPKVNPKAGQETSALAAPILPNAIKEQTEVLTSAGVDTTQPVWHAAAADNTLNSPDNFSMCTSEILETKELLKKDESSFPGCPSSDDNGNAVLLDPASQLNAVREETNSTEALPLEVSVSDGYEFGNSSFQKSGRVADSTGFDLDHFDEFSPMPATNNPRARGKFKPKPQPGRKTDASVASTLPHGMTGKHVTPASTSSDTMQANQTVDVINHRLTDPVNLSSATLDSLGNKGSLENNEGAVRGILLSDKNRSSGLVNSSSQSLSTRVDVGSTDSLHLDVAMSDGSGVGKSTGENADIFLGLECLDGFMSQSTTAMVSTAKKLQPKVDDMQPGNEFPTSVLVNAKTDSSFPFSEIPALAASNAAHAEREPFVPVHSSVNLSSFMVSDAAAADTYPNPSVIQDPVACRETNRVIQVDNGRLETEAVVAFPCLDTLDIISESTITSEQRTLKFLPKPKGHCEKGKPLTAIIPHPDAVEYVSCPQDPQLVPLNAVNVVGGTASAFPPDDVLDFPSMRFDDSIPMDPMSELLVDEEPTDLGETPDAANPENNSTKKRKRKSPRVADLSGKPLATGSEENGVGELSMRLRKRVAAHTLVDEPDDDTHDSGAFPGELSHGFLGNEEDYNDDEYRVEITSPKRQAQGKSEKVVGENEKPVRKRKQATEVLGQSAKQPPKKFSHTTRRNKRRVDKVLLETPEDELDRQNIRLKDLILLAEYKERLANKEATSLKTPLTTNQSSESYFPEDAPYNEEDSVASEQDRGSLDGEEGDRVQEDNSLLNYQSYMDKVPSARWSKQETELFYEAVRQFGADISMIQQLFPNRTRRQVKLKYKKEERQHPSRLDDALRNRTKDHSHFQQVIVRLQQVAAQEKLNSDRDDPIDMTNEEEVPKYTAKPEQKEEKGEPAKEEEAADDDEVPDNVNSHDSDDDFYRWSQYKSDVE